MPADEYTKNLNAVIARKLEKDKTLNEETSRHWQEIAKHRYTFNRGLCFYALHLVCRCN